MWLCEHRHADGMQMKLFLESSLRDSDERDSIPNRTPRLQPHLREYTVGTKFTPGWLLAHRIPMTHEIAWPDRDSVIVRNMPDEFRHVRQFVLSVLGNPPFVGGIQNKIRIRLQHTVAKEKMPQLDAKKKNSYCIGR